MILALLSAYIWKEKIVFKQLAFLCIILFTIILTSVLFNRNIRPIEAIVVRPSLVYCDRGKEFAHVSEDPMRTGSKVEVIEMTDDANWMKISTQEGIKGYIPADCIRII